MTIPALSSSMASDVLSHATAAPPAGSAQTLGSTRNSGTTTGAEQISSATATTSQQSSGTPASLQEVEQAMEEVRSAIAPMAQDLLFSIEEDTGKTIIKVVDSSTDEVIRQIPSEEIITIAKALDNLQGLLLKQKA
ncbi:MAG: flagellar protein [Betaproteobacteria bacterium HGW-Betaproteobacteria-13]|uniref:Flagellar protein n=1 Tax=Parazoarcus communis TaxID=41977 RepID=A0A2U8H6W4_9RHOO|nr:flagellar protein FlaG [Parazoarcus communis]AWI81612.1 flagellar protein [Parazoarcus communis]PKO57188.1 MAG: flagellar protein [Betaproteobacteria bacterium HGW-Betaproteobacteria-21]PKO82465.1 MAG: flagellar protein [Betaproteobacteria bacterium HGW-Betaproteobacteria-13]